MGLPPVRQRKTIFKYFAKELFYLILKTDFHCKKALFTNKKLCAVARIDFANVLRAAVAQTDLKITKGQSHHQRLFVLLGSTCAKAASKTMVKLTLNPWSKFHQCSMSSFYVHRSQKCNNSVKLSVSFYTFGICKCKSCW